VAIFAISHVMKSSGYEHQNHGFRGFRQFRKISVFQKLKFEAILGQVILGTGHTFPITTFIA